MSSVNLAEWQQQFNKQLQATLKVSEKIQEEASKELKKTLEDKSPVGNPSIWKNPPHKDYVPGAFKKSWHIENQDKTIFIYNDRPYAYRIETGWSTQAPSGVLRLGVLEFPNIVDKLARKYKI